MRRFRIAIPTDSNYGFSKPEVEEILNDEYRRIDHLMERFLWIHCGIAFALSFIYSTWMISIPVTLCAFSMFAICRRVIPGSLVTRCVAGISLQAFVALHIYQLHGLPEMHFFFFTAQTMMILYYDARAFWPGTVLIIIQHILFSALTNAGYAVNFFPDSHVTVAKQFFHYSIAVGQVGVCAYWAHYLRCGLVRDTRHRFELLETNAALIDARASADRATLIKSQFLANMSHELRTPLNGVIGMSTLLQEMETDESCRDYVDCIKSSGETLLSLINDILDFSKIEAGKISLEPREFAIEDVVDDVLATMQSKAVEKRLEFLAVVAGDVPRTLKGDPDRIKQIWINLLGNALKFTAEGSVILRVDWDSSGGTRGILNCVVADTGIGIPQEMMETIFESFSQVGGNSSRETGTGLGLAISRQLAQAMGGRLMVESEVGRGSEFTFLLPIEKSNTQSLPLGKPKSCLILEDSLYAAESLAATLRACGFNPRVNADGIPPQPWDIVLVSESLYERGACNSVAYDRLIVTTNEPVDKTEGLTYLRKPFRYSQVRNLLTGADRSVDAPSKPVKPFQGLRFLVVEDNVVNQRILTEMLARQGAEVDLAVNGELGLAAMKMGEYDLIFMDCQMPVMDGFESVRLIRIEEGLTGDRRKIVATTANAMSGDQAECLRSGMDDYVAKPITRPALLAVIRRMLGDREAEPAVA